MKNLKIDRVKKNSLFSLRTFQKLQLSLKKKYTKKVLVYFNLFLYISKTSFAYSSLFFFTWNNPSV